MSISTTTSSSIIEIEDTALKASFIQDAIKQILDHYFSQKKLPEKNNLYALIQKEIEEPLLRVLMEKYLDNQSKVAKALGLSRETTRKLLLKYKITPKRKR
jgi:Fis family transcriptional regulator, factor for inversion stimulation protein